jgi:ureidoacrylate peracid hydrolase
MYKYFFQIIFAGLLIASCKDNAEYTSNEKTDSIVTAKSSSDKNVTYKSININARPESIAIDVLRTAVIVVDMQNDFCTKGGLMDHGGINISMIQKVFDPMAKVLAASREVGIKIIYLKMGYDSDLSDIGSAGSLNRKRELKFHVGDTLTAPDGSKSRFLIRDNWNTNIISELKPHDDDIVIYKNRFSGFYQTSLDSILKQLGTKYLIIGGCTTSTCVESTVRDAMFRDYSAVVLEDCTADPIGYGLPMSNYETSLLRIQNGFGWVSSSDQFIKAIKMWSTNNGQKL